MHPHTDQTKQFLCILHTDLLADFLIVAGVESLQGTKRNHLKLAEQTGLTAN